MSTYLLSLQFALFYKEIVPRPDKTFEEVNSRMGDLFGGMPVVLPIPEGAPREIPVVQLKSEPPGYVCNISRSRIDLVFNRASEGAKSATAFAEFNEKVVRFVTYVLGQVDVVRFGLIAQYVRNDPQSTDSLRKRYVSNELGSISELSIRFNTPVKFEELIINDVVEISSAVEVSIDSKKFNGLLLQRDINNVQSEKSLSLPLLTRISGEFSSRMSETSISELLP